MKRTITLAVGVANDGEYADVIQRAHALQHVIDIQWTTQNKGPHKGQAKRVIDLVGNGPLGFTSVGVHPYESSTTFTALNEEDADDDEATDADVKDFADSIIQSIVEGAFDSHLDPVQDAVDKAARLKASE